MNKYLGEMIEGIDSDQLNFSVWNSSVTLNDMKVKPSFIDNMPLPIQLVYGIVGRIYIDVPVMNIMNKPVVFEMSDVLIIIKPKEMKQWNIKVEEQALKDACVSQLDQWETYLEEQNEDPGKMAQLVTNVINNIQIKISNICIRLEDTVTNPQVPQVISMILQEASIQTMNDKWKQEFTSDTDVTNRSLKIQNFAIYHNWEDIDTKQIVSQMADLSKYASSPKDESQINTIKNNA